MFENVEKKLKTYATVNFGCVMSIPREIAHLNRSN